MRFWSSKHAKRRGALAIASTALLLVAARPVELPAPSWKSFASSFEPGDAVAASLPPSQLVTGRRGKALRINAREGHAELGRQGVVDLSRPGAITCWIRPDQWRAPAANTGYLPLLRVMGTGSSILLVERDRRYPGRNADVWIAGLFSRPSRSEVEIHHELPSLWTETAWHFIAFQWDATGFELRIDDSGPVRVAVPRATLLTAFPKETSRLVVSGGVDEGVLVDDLTVWSRSLSDAELKAIRAN